MNTRFATFSLLLLIYTQSIHAMDASKECEELALRLARCNDALWQADRIRICYDYLKSSDADVVHIGNEMFTEIHADHDYPLVYAHQLLKITIRRLIEIQKKLHLPQFNRIDKEQAVSLRVNRTLTMAQEIIDAISKNTDYAHELQEQKHDSATDASMPE